MIKHKKKLLIISISIGLAVAIAVTFITLSVTVWKPKVKTTQEWLNDFKNSLVSPQDSSEQKTEKSITITENETVVAYYYQLIEIKNQSQGKVAHFEINEEYPTLETDEFDIYDDYYLIDDIMYMQRKSMGEANQTNFASTIEIFWEVVSENLGSASYNFNESNFTNLQLTHEGKSHKLTALISEQKKQSFFVGAEDLASMSEISIAMTYEESGYYDLTIKYKYQDNQFVTIRVIKSEPTEIEIKDFVQR